MISISQYCKSKTSERGKREVDTWDNCGSEGSTHICGKNINNRRNIHAHHLRHDNTHCKTETLVMDTDHPNWDIQVAASANYPGVT